jgi:hypothetical protein
MVEIDLHGARIEEAMRLIDNLMGLAVRRGRTKVSIIHGASTFGTGQDSIKERVYEAIQSGRWSPIGSVVRFEGSTAVALPTFGHRADPTPITLIDISR